MYKLGFQKATNFSGKFYRDQGSGDLVEYCAHILIATPIFEFVDEPVAGREFFYPVKQFAHFDIICTECGECFNLDSESVMGAEQFDHRVQERVKEIEKENKGKKKREGESRNEKQKE